MSNNYIARSKRRTERKSWDLGSRKGLVEWLHQSGKGQTKARVQVRMTKWVVRKQKNKIKMRLLLQEVMIRQGSR